MNPFHTSSRVECAMPPCTLHHIGARWPARARAVCALVRLCSTLITRSCTQPTTPLASLRLSRSLSVWALRYISAHNAGAVEHARIGRSFGFGFQASFSRSDRV